MRGIQSNILEAFDLRGLCLMLGISALLITRPGRCVVLSRPVPFLPLLKQDFGSGWILEGPAYVGPGTLVVVPGLFILS